MDDRLEAVDKLLAEMVDRNAERELAFAILAVDHDDPATINWLAACAAARAAEIANPTHESYTVQRQYEGEYHIIDEEGDRVARVSRFVTGPTSNMVSVSGPSLTPTDMARAVAKAMIRLADEIERRES